MAWLGRRITTPTLLLVAMLVWFAVILGCAIATGELLELAERPDGSTAIDSSITSWVVAHRTHALTTAARLLSTLGSQTVLIPLTAIATVALLGRRRVLAALLVAAWGGAIGMYSLTKHFVHRMRPPMDIWLTNVGRTSSFPSGHATQSLATFLALALVGAVLLPTARWPGRAIALGLAVGVGWSRVYLGVHWATDVGAGWLIAAAWLTIVVWLAWAADSIQQRLRGKRQLET
ncbi:MAG TPA: phosphatase PAP2 family protein [Solirubrobacteraceae bacterium]